jgi:outer membrane immunogenic protein
MIKHSAAAGLALALVAGSAFAADLPYRKGPIIEPPPPFSWTGLYGGVNIGYGFGNSDQDPGYATTAFPNFYGIPAWTIPNNLNGVLGGGQVGFNYQFNPWLVVGLEADVQASDVHSQGNGIGAGAGPFAIDSNVAYATQNKSVDWFGTVRGRVGVTFPSFPSLLIYGTAGLAYGNVVHSANVSNFFPFGTIGGFFFPPGAIAGAGSNYDDTRVGWTAGGGVEWFPFTNHALFKAFSVKLEYLYTDLGSTYVYGGPAGFVGIGTGTGFGYSQTSTTRWSTVRLGVNWHFNPFAPAPVAVLAKY